MKILLFGKNGQVGWELQRSLAPLGEVVALGRSEGDLCGDFSNAAGVVESVRSVRPDVIVNAAAYTAVDKAESDLEMAETINASTPGAIAREAATLGALFVHYSTDYVFDGSKDRPWVENDPTGPLNVYGRTKLAGEEEIRQSGCRHWIFRTSWVYAARGKNFAKTILKLARERETLTVVSDQLGAPTGAELLSDVTALAIRTAADDGRFSGTYHLAAGGETSWHGYAQFLCDAARRAGLELRVREIQPVPASSFSTPARRPMNSRFDTSKLRSTFGLALPDWRVGVERMLAEILEPAQ